MLKELRPDKLVKTLMQPIFGSQRTKEILHINPTILPTREEATEVQVFVYDYNSKDLVEKELASVQDAMQYKSNNRNTCINING